LIHPAVLTDAEDLVAPDSATVEVAVVEACLVLAVVAVLEAVAALEEEEENQTQ